MILSIYDFRNRLSNNSSEPLDAFIEECFLLDDDGLIEVEDDLEQFKVVLVEMEA